MLVVAGKNNIAVHVLEYIVTELEFPLSQLGCVLNKNDYGNNGWQQSLKYKALEYGVAIHKLENLYEQENLIFLSLEFDRLIKVERFQPSAMLLNLHFSCLPQYKGMYTSAWPILNGEKFSGVTLHYIENGIDTGDIIDQCQFSLDPYETARSLYHKYIERGAKLMVKNLPAILKKQVVANKQPYENSSYYSNKSINYSNLNVDFNQTAENIERQVRAFNFREYQYPTFQSREVIGARVLPEKSGLKPGGIVKRKDHSCIVSTVDYNVELFYIDLLHLFFEGCKENFMGKIQYCTALFPAIKYLTIDHGWNCLMVCAYYCSVEAFFFLYEEKLTQQVNYNGTTLLMYAKSGYVKHQKPEILIKLLYEAKVNLLQKDFFGKTVLDYCQENNETNALALLNGESR